MASGTASGGGVGRLVPAQTALLVCDVQERFRPIISGFPAVVDVSRRMVGGGTAGGRAGVGARGYVFAADARARPACTHRPQLRAAAALELPVIVTEQYPKALGSTVEELREHIPEGAPGEGACAPPTRHTAPNRPPTHPTTCPPTQLNTPTHPPMLPPSHPCCCSGGKDAVQHVHRGGGRRAGGTAQRAQRSDGGH